MWHPLTFDFEGPRARQTDNDPNPFLDYRLQVTFTAPGGRTTVVPGFFDGDGRGGPEGNVWRVRFTPSREGTWRYEASFRAGPQLAVSLDPAAGRPAAFDGATGTFQVAHRAGGAPGFLALGRLEYAGGHYFKQSDGPYWLKGGADSPENFLAYAGFRNTRPGKFGLHRYAPHERDFRPGDPDWGDGRGRGIIGALNYLASQKVNSIYFLPMNIGGDGQDTWPFAGKIDPKGHPANDNLHYDVGKLAEWEIVFSHAQRLGIALHVVLNEAEAANKRELDNGELGVERKLFYRELAARFAHHNGLLWNLCEEYNLPPSFGADRIGAFADYLAAQDPYDHPIATHNWHDTLGSWQPFFGDKRLAFTSVQHSPDGGKKFGAQGYSELVETLRARSRAAGHPLVIGMDELDRLGGSPDESRGDKWPWMSGHARLRKAVLWPIYLSGGQIEYIVDTLLETEDFRRYEGMWRYTAIARKFLEENLPFWDMEPEDTLVSGAAARHEGPQVLHKKGDVYAVYLPSAQPSGSLDLRAAPGRVGKRWFIPRTGDFEGEPQSIDGGSVVPLGAPPSDPGEDWAVLLQREPDRLALGSTSAHCARGQAPVFRERDGAIVVDLETLRLPEDGAWSAERDRALPGFTGPGYLRATVEAKKPGPGALTLHVEVPEAGEWHLALRGRHDHPRSDMENDAFLRIDSGPWLKFWIGRPVGAWTWSSSAHATDTDHNHKTPIAGRLPRGLHAITVAARSPNFKLDRLVLARAEALDRARAPEATAMAPASCVPIITLSADEGNRP
jgi:hypothetical protein